jgi:ribonuclease D
LKGPLESPDVRVVMHGADFDIRLLHRDLGIRIRGLFDTQVAAALLGESSLGLASLLEEHLGVKLSKKHQRADWAQRPLPEELLEYAASDTEHLLELARGFEDRLMELGRREWAEEEFGVLEDTRWETDEGDVDPLTRIKGAYQLPPRAATALREALEWRDTIARERDRAPFRVAGDAVLVQVVQARPPDVKSLASSKGISPRLARRHGRELLDRLRRVDQLPESELRPYPTNSGAGHARPSPEDEARSDQLRALRTRKAEALDLERGVLLSNATIGEIIRAKPFSVTELRAIPGVRRWQAELLGREIVAILSDGTSTGKEKRGAPS